MKISEKNGEIILRDTPFASWVSGTVLSVIFVFSIYAVVSGAIESPNYQFGLQDRWYWIAANVLWFVFIVAVCGGGFFFFFRQILTPVLTARIKPADQTVDVIRHRLIFFRRQQRFYFSQIKSFILASRAEDNKSSYYVVLKLVNDDEIDLQSAGNPTTANLSVITRLNDILKNYHPKNKGKTQRLKKRKAKREMKPPEK